MTERASSRVRKCLSASRETMSALLLAAIFLAPPARAGDIQVGPAVDKLAAETKKRSAPSRLPGIYPVYLQDGHWMLVDRGPKGASGRPALGGRYLVVGSKAADLFTIAKSSMVAAPLCVKNRPVKSRVWFLQGHNLARVGTPIIAIRLPPGARVDTKAAQFYSLINEVNDGTYALLGGAVKDAVVADVKSGAFLVKLDDPLGYEFSKDPKPDGIMMKIDFGSKIRVAGMKKAFVAVDGAQISKTYRRCLRLYSDDKPVGDGVEMPHALMAETTALDFVAYDPSGAGKPFILAYTSKEPLWGHERWGFQVTRDGPKAFLTDALDPKCRERF